MKARNWFQWAIAGLLVLALALAACQPGTDDSGNDSIDQEDTGIPANDPDAMTAEPPLDDGATRDDDNDNGDDNANDNGDDDDNDNGDDDDTGDTGGDDSVPPARETLPSGEIPSTPEGGNSPPPAEETPTSEPVPVIP
jgi:hypothetical protein